MKLVLEQKECFGSILHFPNQTISPLFPDKTDKSKRKGVCFSGKVLADKKSARFFLGPFLIQPIILFVFVLIFLLTDQRWLENTVRGSWAGQICPFLAKNFVYILLPSQKLLCMQTEIKKSQKNHSDHHGINKKL